MPQKLELEQLVQWFDDSESATMTARELSERDRDFYDGKQWTEAEAAELSKRGQPQTVFNRIAPKIDFILGMEAQTRTSPKALPRTPVEESGANVATDVIRYICDVNDWDQERSDCGEDLFIEGTCGIDVRIEEDTINGGQKVKLERIPWDRLFWDPHSRFSDFRDAKYYGTITWMDVEDAETLWPHAKDIIEQSVSQSGYSLDDTYDDRPKLGVWSDKQSGRPRVKVCQVWYHNGGEWYWATYTKAGFFEKPEVSPYIDESLKTVPGLILQSSKVDRDNNRYGVVRMLISPQEEINKRRSKGIHHLTMRQVIAEAGAVQDRDVARAELAKADGYIEVRPDARFEIAQNADMSSGHFQMLAEAKAEIDSIGANSALTGKDPRQHSGRAIQARQQGGAIELARIFDRFRHWQRRVYESVWLRARQFWTEEKVIRVTDDERNLKYLGLNRPITALEMMEHRGAPLPPPEQMTPELQQQLQQVVSTGNQLATLDVDIKIDESPDFLTLQEEQFDMLTKLMSAIGGALPQPAMMLMLKLIIEASGLRAKKKMVEMLETGGATPEQQQEAAQQQEFEKQLMMQNASLDLQKKQADIQKTASSALKDRADAEASLHEVNIEAANTQLKALGLLKGDNKG